MQCVARANSILCSSYLLVHKKCSSICGRLSANPGFVCPRCQGKAQLINCCQASGIPVDDCSLDVESEFCYLGDVLSAGGGCAQAIIARSRIAWGKFRKLRPLLTSRDLSPRFRGRVFNSIVRSALLHGSETWAPTASDLLCLQRTDRAMVRWICGVRLRDEIPTVDLLAKLGLEEISSALRTRRLRWHGHVARSSGSIHEVTEVMVPGSRGRGRPRKTWRECVKRDIRECGLTDTDPLDRAVWRAGVNANRLLPTPVTADDAAV